MTQDMHTASNKAIGRALSKMNKAEALSTMTKALEQAHEILKEETGAPRATLLVTRDLKGRKGHFTPFTPWRTEDEAFNRSMQTKVAAMRRFAFEDQDAPVIEAQQRNLNSANRVLHPVLLECDAGPARYQRVLRQLIKAESGG
jgi:hypothetical protein